VASAILCAAPALEQTPAPMQHLAPSTLGVATPLQRLPVQPVQALSAKSSPDTIAKPASEPAIGETKHEPRTNSLATGCLPRDLSPWGMFRNAVLTVKIVRVGLVIASVATRTVELAKTIELWKARRWARRRNPCQRNKPELRRSGTCANAVSGGSICRGGGRRSRAAGWP
jgi:biopolymer transport protein ExbB